MKGMLQGSRGLLVALAVLALSATMVLAAKPDSSQSPACEHGQSATHTDQTGCTNPVTPGTEGTDDQGTQAGTDTETTDSEAADAGGDHCTTDPTKLSVDELAATNHGSIVCWAAHAPTPVSFDNHGAFVSHWAHQGKNSASQKDATHGKADWGQSHKP